MVSTGEDNYKYIFVRVRGDPYNSVSSSLRDALEVLRCVLCS